MTVVAADTIDSPKASLTDLADLSPCPSCGALLAEPQASNYLGLGRIEHIWHCGACGTKFRSMASVAGMIHMESSTPAANG